MAFASLKGRLASFKRPLSARESTSSKSVEGLLGVEKSGLQRRSSAHDCPLRIQLLTAKEKDLVSSAWAQVKCSQPFFIQSVWLNALGRSGNISTKIVGLPAGASKLETRRRGVCQDEILSAPSFRRAVGGMEAFLESAIGEWELASEKLCAESLKLGARHAAFFDHGFQALYWDLFSVALVEEFEGTGKERDTVYAWQKLVHLILTQMLEGYRDARNGPTLAPNPLGDVL